MSVKKNSYKKDIIKQLYFAHTLSCAEISEKTDKSLPLTTKIVNELIGEEYITENGYAPSSGGRRPQTYSLKPDVLYTVSVAMDQFVTRIVIMDMQNRYVTTLEKFELTLAKNPAALLTLAEKIANHITSSGLPKAKIAGVGIGMPGFIDPGKGLNYTFLEPPYGNIPAFIADKTGLDVFIDNDSSLIALAELRFGAAKHKANGMVVNLGWGVGLGLVLEGKLFRGSNGFAGEFSHIPVFNNNKLCGCGKKGCLETETSLSVIIDKAKTGLAEGQITILQGQLNSSNAERAIEEIIKAAHQGDQFAVELFSEAGYNIGRGVAILVHILNPETIVLSGRGSLAGKIWKAPIQQAINEHCIPRLAANTEIEVSALGYEAELIGSAALVMENYESKVAIGVVPVTVPTDFYAKNN
jgi:predicted NBD/HSP70 family sugar kinase